MIPETFLNLNYEEIELRLLAHSVSYSCCPYCGQQVTAGRALCGHNLNKTGGYARSTVVPAPEPLKVSLPTPDVWKKWPGL